MEDFWGVFFGNYQDPNEHIPTGFALVAVISFIGCFGPFVASSKGSFDRLGIKLILLKISADSSSAYFKSLFLVIKVIYNNLHYLS